MIRILVATTAALLANSASASEPIVITDGVPTAHVSYADLNLQTSAGRAHLTQRIHSTAERMCMDSNAQVIVTEPDRKHCYQVATASGIAQLEAIAAR